LIKVKRECIICGEIKPKNQCLCVQYYNNTGRNKTLINEYVCCEKCADEFMKELYAKYKCRVNVIYPYKYLEAKFNKKSELIKLIEEFFDETRLQENINGFDGYEGHIKFIDEKIVESERLYYKVLIDSYLRI
jgi:hypothetical protein